MNVYASSNALLRLWTFIESLKTEVGGWGYAFLDPDNSDNLTWTDVFLVPQEVSGAEVDFERTQGDAYAVERAIEDGVMDKEGFIWVSWHSHHTMQAFWSGTDEKRIEKLGLTGIKSLLSFVGTHDHKYKLRLDLFNIEHAGIKQPQITIDDLTLHVDDRDEQYGAIFDEIARNVRKAPTTPKVSVWDSKRDTWVPPAKKGDKPATKKVTPAKADELEDPGEMLERALAIRELMAAGLSHQEAAELYDDSDGSFVFPLDAAAVVRGGDGFDAMAWEGLD